MYEDPKKLCACGCGRSVIEEGRSFWSKRTDTKWASSACKQKAYRDRVRSAKSNAAVTVAPGQEAGVATKKGVTLAPARGVTVAKKKGVTASPARGVKKDEPFGVKFMEPKAKNPFGDKPKGKK